MDVMFRRNINQSSEFCFVLFIYSDGTIMLSYCLTMSFEVSCSCDVEREREGGVVLPWKLAELKARVWLPSEASAESASG